MQSALLHRGPDQQNTAFIKDELTEVRIGASRLSIRGGIAGNQPLIGQNGIMLAFNGELFGYQGIDRVNNEILLEWCDWADTDGEFSIGESDSHDLLKTLESGIYDFIHRQEGMAAFAAGYKANDTKLILGRDVFGIKPLWVYSRHDKSAFFRIVSSEARAILSSNLVQGAPDPALLPELLSYRCVHGSAGLFKDFRPFQPGETQRFAFAWESEPIEREGYPLKNAQPWVQVPSIKHIKWTIYDSLLQNLTSDRPVGIMLSGGIDSGLLACMAAEAGHKLPCFTTEGPEAAAAEALAKRLGHPFHLVPVPRGTNDWLEFLRHSPSPIADPGGYMTWCVARAAKAAGVPVLLSGAGADEVFLGYRRHEFWHRRQGWLNSRLFKMAAPLLHKIDSRFSKAALGDPMQVYRQTMAAPGNLANYLGLETPKLLNSSIPQLPDVLWLDLFTYLPDQVLLATDLYSMAHSVEVRVPYLTRKLVQMAWKLGADALLKEGTKTPLRQLFKEYGGVITPKTGFGPTEAQYPDFKEMDEALGLDTPTHSIYAHLPFAQVAQWRGKKMGLQARMAFWCAGMQMAYSL